MTIINSAHSKTRKLSISATIITTAILAGCGGSAETNTKHDAVDPTLPVSDWVMVWNDEFDGATINKNKWTHEINCSGGGNNEAQCYTDSKENSFVADGMLNIVAKPAEEGAEKPYTSARLVTKDKGDWTYGRFEMRAKLPSGQGSWPAFWMLPTDEVYGGWPHSGEIDIVESVNLKAATSDGGTEANIYGTLHYGASWPDNDHSGQAYSLPNNLNPADDFHTYAVEWQEGEIRWYVDNYLYATQLRSEVRTNSKGEAVGLSHRGWYTEFYDMITGEFETNYSNAPFDQDFHIILNFAVGGDWPENANDTGIDEAAFANGQAYIIDYVRVYECSINPNTGEGCDTIRAGYKDEPTLVEGEAPSIIVAAPPSNNVNLTIFDDAVVADWLAWDCCGGSTPTIETDDTDHGATVEFVIGAAPTVMGFTTKSGLGGGDKPFDASGALTTGSVSFDMKLVTAPNDAGAAWKFKIESNDASEAVELDLNASNEGADPVVGEWQTYTFTLQSLADAGLDISALDTVMIFPAWGAGEGAVYRVDNVSIGNGGTVSYPELIIFEDAANVDWPLWDCCGGSTPAEASDDAEHGITAEFVIGASPTVMGFTTKGGLGGTDMPFDASALLTDGVVQFEMNVVTAPNDASSPWKFKIESNDAGEAVELDLNASTEGADPVTGVWQTYTFTLQSLSDAGLDISAIDTIMIFPAWGQGEGAVYRVDNVKVYNPNATSGGSGSTASINLFKDVTATDWVVWDCCGGSTPTIETDDADHGAVAEFVIGASPTVMGIITKSANGGGDAPFDASSILATGSISFDMKVVTAPNDSSAVWKFKVESNDASEAVELDLTDSLEGTAPAVGVWQTYTFPLQTLLDAGLDVSVIDVVMFFPAWGTGEGAVYRVDNVAISAP